MDCTSSISVSLFVVTMDMTILIMALPELVRELEPSGTQQLWIVDIYSLVLGLYNSIECLCR